MAKVVDTTHEHFERSRKPYVFRGPDYIAIRTRTNDQPRYVDTRADIWTWSSGGIIHSIKWRKLGLSSEVTELAKGFISYALEKYAPATVEMYARFLRALSKTDLAHGLPWDSPDIIVALESLKRSRHNLISFRIFYRWAVNRAIDGFDQTSYRKIKDTKSDKVYPYERLFLSQTGLEIDEEIRLLERIRRPTEADAWLDVQSNVMLQLGFELGLRSIQFYALDITDFELIKTTAGEHFYTLWVPMAKKVGQTRPERRPRKITPNLGENLEQHTSHLRRYFEGNCDALFVDGRGKRLTVTAIAGCLKRELGEAGISKPNQVSMLLRHHLGQGLADQGAPAAVIAELLGHNSTVPARAYISATPNIARIKEKALGKSPTYQSIMRSLLTGEIVRHRETAAEREIKGVVGTQYIGGIGACALPNRTPCPYNPVYACYTCRKFHPFADGRHEAVKAALEEEAQRFIDVAERTGSSSYNRPMVQHQTTILAVKATIERCKQHVADHPNDDSV